MPTPDTIQILAVDDEKSIRRLIQKELSAPHREIALADTAKSAVAAVKQHSFDVIILDIRLPDGDGIELMERFRGMAPEAEVILITGHGDIDGAVEAMKMGAYDYITKPFDLDRLEVVVEKAHQRARLRRENRLLRHAQSDGRVGLKLIGHSPAMEEVRYLAGRVAPTGAPVLLTGESGTGKSAVAAVIHGGSGRTEHALVTKNCGTLQHELIRSELFGHRKGAFTGADESRDGLMALAHKGTLFLDEIGELPLEVQAALLRVLETGTYRRVGDKEERVVDIRFIFATNRLLKDEVKAGRFSEALYHRINVFNIDLAPLRDRKEDLPALVEYFLGKLCTNTNRTCRVSRSAMGSLMAYDWPGNIRELQNVIERGIILSEDGVIAEKALPRELTTSASGVETESPFPTLADLERIHIQRVMNWVEGNRTQAAGILGIGRKTLYRKLKEFGDISGN
jgi:two-component system NtrC family response regulator